jgi:phosphoglycerate dehydrogenase-like enzyme
VTPEGLKHHEPAKLIMTAVNEGAEMFVNYVKSGILNTDALQAAVKAGSDAEIALKKLEKEGYKI